MSIEPTAPSIPATPVVGPSENPFDTAIEPSNPAPTTPGAPSAPVATPPQAAPSVPSTPPVTATPAPTTPSPGPSSAPAVTMSPEQLSQVVASVVKGAQPAEIPKAFDQAEFDKTFNVVKVAKEDLDVLAQGGEKAVEKMHDLLQRTSKQAVTMTNYLVEDRMKNLMGQLQPYLQFANEMRESQFRGEFMDKNKDLAEYSPIVDEVVQNLNRSGIKGSKEEIFTKISTEARRLIAVAGGKLTVPAGAGQPGGQPSIMPTLPSGGQRGASTGGSDKSLAENIFGG